MKKKILFITKNIPLPNEDSNQIIYTIAEKLFQNYNIVFFFPKEKIPFFLRKKTKFKHLANLNNWKYKSFKIYTFKYVKTPFKKFEYWFSSLFIISAKHKKVLKNISIIHAQYIFPDGIIANKIFNRFNIPYVVTIRNHDVVLLKQINKFNIDYNQAKRVLENAKSVLVLNLPTKKFIEKNFNVKTTLIPHGISYSLIEQGERTPIEIQSKQIQLTLIKRQITKSVNLDWVIELAKNNPKNYFLNIIGNLEYSKKFDDYSNIKFNPPLKFQKIVKILESSDIFILPTSYETFGLVYLEAAALKNMLVGFKGQGVDGLFNDNQEIILIENKKDLIEKISKLDRAQILNYKRNAFNKVKKYTWKNIIPRYIEIYNTVIKNSNK